jgi:hypothetical protein
VALLIAVGIGIFVILCHRGAVTASLVAYGAAIGLGAVLGFLFGVPGNHKAVVNVSNVGTVAAGTGGGGSTISGNVKVSHIEPSNAETPPATSDAGSVVSSTIPPDASPNNKPATATAKATDPSDAELPPLSSPTPSNLEQVADWVTKLLLGGGLTQMQRIPPTVWQWAHLVALGILRDSPTASPQLILAQQAFASGLLVYGYILGFFGGFLVTKLQLGTAIL